MSKSHKVRDGECLTSIAARYGMLPETIWSHPDNESLKEKRTDANVLYPGDKLVIPDSGTGTASGATEERHTFRRLGVPSLVRIQVCDYDDPIANEAYTLTVDGESFDGTTDSDGVVEHPIPPHSKRVTLKFEAHEDVFEFEMGHLDPIDTNKGVQTRLTNLGMDAGPSDGEIGPKTRSALKLFQHKHALEVTGEIDDATRDKIREEHGS